MNLKIFIITEATAVDAIGTLEDLFLAREQLRIIDNGYQELNLDAPEWIAEKTLEIEHEINLRVRGELQRKLRTARARRSALRSADEKRNDLDREIAELEAKVQ